MATNPDRIVVAQMARVHLAPYSGALDLTAIRPTGALPAPFTEVGLFTPDSLNWSTEPSFEEVRSHQSFYPTRRMQTEDNATLSVDLQEWSADNFIATYGGGTVEAIMSEGASPTIIGYRYSPPPPGARAEVAAVAEVIDGSKHYRYVIPRAMQVEGVEQDLGNASESTMPLRLAALGVDSGDPWFLVTDDEAFSTVAGNAVSMESGPQGYRVSGTTLTAPGTEQQENYEEMTADELRDELRKQGQPLGGNKEDLIARLQGEEEEPQD